MEAGGGRPPRRPRGGGGPDLQGGCYCLSMYDIGASSLCQDHSPVVSPQIPATL
jgi:hypothetical protein